MTEEQIKQKFKETYPDFMRGDEPLSPYFDIWEYAIEIATKELQEEVNEWKTKFESLKRKCSFNIVDLLEDVEKEAKQEQRNKELEAQVKYWMSEYDKLFNED